MASARHRILSRLHFRDHVAPQIAAFPIHIGLSPGSRTLLPTRRQAQKAARSDAAISDFGIRWGLMGQRASLTLFVGCRAARRNRRGGQGSRTIMMRGQHNCPLQKTRVAERIKALRRTQVGKTGISFAQTQQATLGASPRNRARRIAGRQRHLAEPRRPLGPSHRVVIAAACVARHTPHRRPDLAEMSKSIRAPRNHGELLAHFGSFDLGAMPSPGRDQEGTGFRQSGFSLTELAAALPIWVKGSRWRALHIFVRSGQSSRICQNG